MPENPADDSSTVPVEQNDSTASGNGRETVAAEPTVVATTESDGDRIVGAAAVERHAASADAARADSPSATVAATGHRPRWALPHRTAVRASPGPRSTPPRSNPDRCPGGVPAGVLSATVLSGVAAALFIPLDRPGIGWLLTGLIVAAAIVTVDYTARRSTNRSRRTTGDGALADTVIEAVERAPESDASTSTAQPKPAETSGSAVRVADSERPPAAALAGGASTRTTDGAASSSNVAETHIRTTTPTSGTEQPEVGAGASPFRFGARVWWSALALALLAVGAFRARNGCSSCVSSPPVWSPRWPWCDAPRTVWCSRWRPCR